MPLSIKCVTLLNPLIFYFWSRSFLITVHISKMDLPPAYEPPPSYEAAIHMQDAVVKSTSISNFNYGTPMPFKIYFKAIIFVLFILVILTVCAYVVYLLSNTTLDATNCARKMTLCRNRASFSANSTNCRHLTPIWQWQQRLQISNVVKANMDIVPILLTLLLSSACAKRCLPFSFEEREVFISRYLGKCLSYGLNNGGICEITSLMLSEQVNMKNHKIPDCAKF